MIQRRHTLSVTGLEILGKVLWNILSNTIISAIRLHLTRHVTWYATRSTYEMTPIVVLNVDRDSATISTKYLEKAPAGEYGDMRLRVEEDRSGTQFCELLARSRRVELGKLLVRDSLRAMIRTRAAVSTQKRR